MSEPRVSVLIATTNRGKLVEIRALLEGLPIELLTLSDVLPDSPPVEETGSTFLENALLKARAGASASGLLTLAEDSGLEVDALNGEPGVYSARYSGEGATHAANNKKLLAALEGVDDARRTARFRCSLVMLDPASPDDFKATDGTCEGAIARAPQGSGGFGYDPIFFVRTDAGNPMSLQTMAELSEDEKNRISHRARAFIAMRPLLEAELERRRGAAERAQKAEREPRA
jgi:XTP/dITP diphosphohydrolase